MAEEKKKTQGEQTPTTPKNEDTGGKERVFTQDEVNKMIGEYRKEDKQKLSEEYELKLQETVKQMEERIKTEREEAERVAKLSAQEREKELLKKQEEEQKAKDRELTLRENRLSAINKLDELEVPIKLVDFVVDTNVDKMGEKISALKESFDGAVEERVAKRLDGSPKKDINDSSRQPSKQPLSGII